MMERKGMHGIKWIFLVHVEIVDKMWGSGVEDEIRRYSMDKSRKVEQKVR
jgi:hypothetical protein